MLRSVALAIVSTLLLSAAPKVVLFQAPGFPAVDAPGVSPVVMSEALKGLDAVVCDSPETLAARLAAGADVLVLPYGSAFPLDAFEAIRGHLDHGGGLVVLGGAPLHQPVRREAGQWVLGLRQPTFAHAFLFGPAEAIDTAGLKSPLPTPGSEWTATLPMPAHTWALTVRFGTRREALSEMAQDAPQEAILRPLVRLSDGQLPRACALQEIDRLRGFGAGGRWVFATHDAPMDAVIVRALVERALQGACQIEVRPVQACVEPGDTARMRVFVHRPKGASPTEKVHLRLLDESGKALLERDADLSGPAATRFAEVALPTKRPLGPGLYKVEISLPGETRVPFTTTSGFWVRDAKLLAGGAPITLGRDWFRRNGQVYPVLGTTYMSSEVHRRFLFQPNPALWDADFDQMKAQGVNFVRTGLWAFWNRLMTGPSSLDDGALRALDAFVLSAAKHDIPVCFTFFAFLPPTYGGDDPYLDPKSLEAQESLLTQVASRYKGSPWVQYDLINEPSWCPPEALWTNQPIGDRYESEAWARWLQAQGKNNATSMRDDWRAEGPDVLGLPRADEVIPGFLKEDRSPRKVRDFRIFTQEAFAGWAARLRETLRLAGGQVLVTVGQDEGGLGVSPSHQFMAEKLDYTSMHNWWQNDDLLWDGVLAKVPEKPMLIQETGLMRLEDVDGRPWRSPEAAARLLERKFALSFASRAAGAVQWAWNINIYQPSENEAGIGFLRADGTAKTELRVLREYADFFAKAAPYLDDFHPNTVVVVLPHSRLFMGRPKAQDGVKRVIRTLSESFGIVPTALSELRLTPERLKNARLILVPTPEWLEPSAASALKAAADHGVKVLITGALEGDPLGRSLPGLGSLVDAGRPLTFRESTSWTASGQVSFPELLDEQLRRSISPALPKTLTGELIHEPLPIEYAREEEALHNLLAAALDAAGVPIAAQGTPLLTRVLETDKVALVIAVNEAAQDQTRSVRLAGRTYAMPVAAGRSRLALVDKKTGSLLFASPGAPIR